MSSLLRYVYKTTRPVLATNYSSVSTKHWDGISEILSDEGTRQQQQQQQQQRKGPSKLDQKDLPKWKAFEANRVVRPHELTYKARFNAPRTYHSRKAAVAPPSNVARYTDVFYQFKIDPLSQAQNPAILSHFMSEMGKVYNRSVTGLTSKSQRRIGKAIRRAKMMGVIPILSRPRSLSSNPKNRR